MNMQHNRPHIPSRQAGMVSMMVTMIIMLVMSLIVLGFAQISRREQRQALDRQLSTQAFYAAESAINDARKVISAWQASSAPIPEKNTCPTTTGTVNYPFNSVINPANNVSYTCLLVTTRVQNININPLTAAGESSKVVFEPDGGSANVMHISWKAATTVLPTDFARCDAGVPAPSYLPKTSAWQCPYGVLRMDIVPTNSLTRAAMVAGQKTIFLYPTKSGSGTIDYATANGAVAAMKCMVGSCEMDITNLASSGSAKYALRLSSIYTSGSVDITALTAVGGTKMLLNNAQIQIDATGKAQDVLRRVQVRLPMTPAGKTPDNALESGSSICKRFEVGDGIFKIPGDIQGQDQKNPLCRVTSIAPPPPPTGTTACSLRGSNQLALLNGDFSRDLGSSAMLTNQAVSGFTSNLPYRGLDIFPDDDGLLGSTAEFRGWSGGLSRHTAPKASMNFGFTQIKPFLGDTSITPAVPPNNFSIYTNPNQSILQPKGTRSNGATYTGPLWEATLTGLKADTKYDFSGYFANILTDYFYDFNRVRGLTPVDPIIEFSVDGVILRPAETITQSQSNWRRITLTFTTAPGQTTARFVIKDFAGNINGDDFAMTSMGVYECL